MGPGQYLLDAFHKLRFARDGLEGMMPQTWVEVDAFARATGRISPGWEVEVLFDMSWAYVIENQKAADPMRIAPMERENG